MKHDKRKMDIIRRGQRGQLEDVEELRIYRSYLEKNRDKNIKKKVKEVYRDEYFAFLISMSIAVILLLGPILILPFVFIKKAILGIGLLILIIALNWIIPYYDTKNKLTHDYDEELGELITLIVEKESEKRLKEKQEIKEKEEDIDKNYSIENTKIDKFIANIAKDIEVVINNKYDGYEKDLLALKSLAKLYLDEKMQDRDNYLLNKLSVNPEHFKILIGIEDSINNNIKLKQMRDDNIETLLNAFGDEEVSKTDDVMNSDELKQYIISNKQKVRTLK